MRLLGSFIFFVLLVYVNGDCYRNNRWESLKIYPNENFSKDLNKLRSDIGFSDMEKIDLFSNIVFNLIKDRPDSVRLISDKSVCSIVHLLSRPNTTSESLED